ncbi:hypothetical protein [Tannockella kyphosi]|uniref:hypothetical protein n=1 Tax=Tannockella kyphosi TaxID=2899121 RepID=UPI002013019B|nr:hypothetical protein [Tannockella kyphosi]
MELVLIGGQYKRIAAFIETHLFIDLEVKITKVKQPRIYLEVTTQEEFEVVQRKIKHTIMKDLILSRAFFEIYPIFEGKVDFASYLSPERKKKLAYYKEEV